MKTINQVLQEMESVSTQSTEQKIVSQIDSLLRSIKVAHWNVTGANFISFHTFLGEVYEQLAGVQDRLAEALKAQGFTVSLNGVGPVEGYSPEPFYRMLLSELAEIEVLVNQCISECQNEVVKNILTDVSESLGKWRWFITSSFQ